jgi:hypothetical protein
MVYGTQIRNIVLESLLDEQILIFQAVCVKPSKVRV